MAQREFEDFADVAVIIDRIAAILEQHSNERIFDYDVAAVLRIDAMNLATRKKRNRPPLNEILRFCQRTGVDPIKLLF